MAISSVTEKALLASNKVSPEQLEIYISSAKARKQHLFDYLDEYKILSPKGIYQQLSDFSGIPWLDITEFDSTTLPESLLNQKLIEKHQACPIFTRGNMVYVALSDPQNMDALNDFQFNLGQPTSAILVERKQLKEFIEKILENDSDALHLSDSDEAEFKDIEFEDEHHEEEQVESPEKDDAPIVVFINKILFDAIRKGASDLHFEPYEHEYRIRFRIDGILRNIANPPANLSSRISARIKVMSNLDIAERRVPQDGRIKLRLSQKKSIDFRVSTLPTLWGEKIVMRILDSSSAMMGIDFLGYEKVQKNHYLSALDKPQGMILVTGPTGSGKTVSLYTGLNLLNTPERNISTAEDPVEINLPGINQVQINPRAGLQFADALKSFLRQDPDVIMVGEIRDLETAEIAIKAAQTGHLVLSTLHTNSAPETLTRLMNMGVPAYNIASSVSLIIAQRLARRLCGKCKEAEDVPDQELLRFGFSEQQLSEKPTIYKAVGCEHCSEGYKGRVGIYQVMPISGDMASMIMNSASSIEIAEQAKKEDINDLRASCILKVMQGVTTLTELNRVTGH